MIYPIFDKAAPIYNEALKKRGFTGTLNFLPTVPTRHHTRKSIIWFSRPFSRNVKTNVGKLPFALVQKYFPRHHKYKLFNKDHVKVSYSCKTNMKSVNLVSNHTVPVAGAYAVVVKY